MYGMVNKALESMVREEHGDAVWLRIRETAGIDVELFLSSEAYPDDITYRMVGAASTVLNQPAAQILRDFGRYWVLRTAREGYGDLMSSGGRTLREFLVNLPHFHTRINLIFPHLQPPEFHCTHIEESSLRLHYRSGREGLSPFVVGLIEGLGEMFETPVTVEALAELDPGDREAFLIRWQP